MLSAMPVCALEVTSEAAHSAVVRSGTCGKNAEWVLDEEGTLTISGSGEIESFSFYEQEDISSVIISEGITRIGDYAFCKCSSLKEVTIPESCERAGENSFSECSELRVLKILSPDFKSFEAFLGLLENGLTVYGYKNSTARSFAVLNDCDFVSLGYYIDPDIVPERSGKCGEDLTWQLDEEGTLTISGTGDIAEKAFCGNIYIKNVVISEGVTGIGWLAFSNCGNISSVKIADTVTHIDIAAFEYCEALRLIVLPESVAQIRRFAFAGCTALEYISIPTSLKSIGEEAFKDTKWLENQRKASPYVVVNGILIDAAMCPKEAVIPDTVEIIGDSAFRDSDDLEAVTLPDSVTSIAGCAFFGCTGLKSITIPESVTSIGGGAFANCQGIKSITIPRSVGSILENTFFYCRNIEEITILDPDCYIHPQLGLKHKDDDDYDSGYDGVIRGYKGSTAQEYAEANGYKFVALDENAESYSSGDANCDGGVDLADAVTIMQALANPNKYGLNGTEKTHITAQGIKNADVIGSNGMTTEDAGTIQSYLLHIIDKLPVEK